MGDLVATFNVRFKEMKQLVQKKKTDETQRNAMGGKAVGKWRVNPAEDCAVANYGIGGGSVTFSSR